MTKKNFWNDPEKGSIFLCLSMVGLGLPCLCSLSAVCLSAALPRRPPPARVAAHKYIDARAISCDSRSGGKSAARTWRGVWNEREWRRHRCTSVGVVVLPLGFSLSPSLPLSLPVTLLIHAARECLTAIVAVVPQAEQAQQLFRALCGSRGVDAPEASDEFEIFPRGQLVVEQRLVRQPGDMLLGGGWIAAGVDAKDADFAGIRIEQARDHAQRRGLARAVGAEQGVKLAALHLEADAIHGALAAKALGEAGNLEAAGHCVEALFLAARRLKRPR